MAYSGDAVADVGSALGMLGKDASDTITAPYHHAGRSPYSFVYNTEVDAFFDGESFVSYIVLPGPMAKNDVTEEDVRAALDNLLVYDQVSEQPKKLLLGFDGSGRLLELVGGINDDGVLVIWHGMKCRPTYLRLLPSRWRRFATRQKKGSR